MTQVAEPVPKLDGEGNDPATDLDLVSNEPMGAAEDDVASSRGPVPTLRYTKADLMALSQLEVCKKQPEALDSSILKYFCRILPYSAAFCHFRPPCPGILLHVWRHGREIAHRFRFLSIPHAHQTRGLIRMLLTVCGFVGLGFVSAEL